METVVGGAVIGAAVAMVAPSIVPGIASALRPLAKEVIKGGLIVYNAVSGLIAETSEQFSDLVAEAKAEINKPAPSDNGAKGDGGGK
ncbi:DUF5132 domain-containing protein [Nitrospira sp. Kam-Ns4a]